MGERGEKAQPSKTISSYCHDALAQGNCSSVRACMLSSDGVRDSFVQSLMENKTANWLERGSQNPARLPEQGAD